MYHINIYWTWWNWTFWQRKWFSCNRDFSITNRVTASSVYGNWSNTAIPLVTGNSNYNRWNQWQFGFTWVVPASFNFFCWCHITGCFWKKASFKKKETKAKRLWLEIPKYSKLNDSFENIQVIGNDVETTSVRPVCLRERLKISLKS